MKRKEPKFMQELHKIRAQLSKEWREKTTKEISASLHKTVQEFKSRFAYTHH